MSFHAYDYYLDALGQYGNSTWQSSWNSSGPVFISKAKFILRLLAQYNASGKFLMNTETGLLCDNCSNDPTFENTKAFYLAQSFAAAIAEGLRANVWYSAQGWRNSGLLGSKLNPRPAYTAFQFAQSELGEAVWVRDVIEYTGVRGYEFQRGNRRVWVLWSLDGNAHPIKFSSAPLAAWDALGVSVKPDGTMIISLEPLYLEWSP